MGKIQMSNMLMFIKLHVIENFIGEVNSLRYTLKILCKGI
jgi:hypothetical protein